MPNTDQPSYPPGHQPYDNLVGMRIGALVGGFLGIAAVIVLGGTLPWLIIPFAVVGAVAGFLWQNANERKKGD